ncbi:partial [Hexamita inflata]|uniref:Partial n=1 Tax=Hexamita inflata TaxID=28002 RepID=A0ABP1GH04_9EUKA
MLESRILSNYSLQQLNLLHNTTTLDQRIQQNATQVNNMIIMNSTRLEKYIISNSTALNWMIYNNITAINQSIQNIENNIVYLNNLTTQLSKIVQQNISSLEGYIKSNITKVESVMILLEYHIQQNISALQTQQQALQSSLENSIQSNFTQALLNLQDNTTVLDKRIFDNASMLLKNIQTNSTNIEQYLEQNASILDWRLYNNITALNSSLLHTITYIITCLQAQINCTNNIGYSFINNSCVEENCSISGQQRRNGICQCTNVNSIIQSNACMCPLYSVLIGSTCTCPLNSYLVTGICECTITGQTMKNGTCVCELDEQVIDGICQKVYVVNGSDTSMQCTQTIYINVFDISYVTHQVPGSANFSNGYVFSISNIIQNAFIDVFDGVYSTTQPLFQSQSSFINIKIQIGTQSLTGGSILTSSSTITINKMYYISKIGCQLTVNSVSSLNLFITSSTSVNINDLHINLRFSMSLGNISLINSISGEFYISGYQLQGAYQSTLQVNMIGFYVQSSSVTINRVNIKPSVFNVGNCSSYMFGTVNTSVLIINKIALINGNVTSSLPIGSVSTQGPFYQFYQFSGIITNMNSSTITVNYIVADCYWKFTSDYVTRSGLLIGNAQSKYNNLNVQYVCLQQNIIITKQLYGYGLVGQYLGNSSISKLTITMSIYGQTINCIGVVGTQQNGGQYNNIQDLRIIMIVSSATSGDHVAAVIGAEQSINCTVQNIVVINSNIISSCWSGGIIGNLYSNCTILNTSLSASNISGISAIGGFVGNTQSMSMFNINSILIIKESSINNIIINLTSEGLGGFIGASSKTNIILAICTIQQTHIIAVSKYGIVLGADNTGTSFTITDSSSKSNYINNSSVSDCAAITNVWSITQCT